MTDENNKQRFINQWLIPIAAAVVGGVVGSIVQATVLDKAQIHDIVALLKDPALNPDQKLKALQIYQDVTDRPWGIIRSLVTYLGIALGSVLGALTVGGHFNKK